MLARFVYLGKTDWDEHFLYVMMAYWTKNGLIGYLWNMLVFTQEVHLPVGMMHGPPARASVPQCP